MRRPTRVFIDKINGAATAPQKGDARTLVDAEILSENSKTVIVKLAHDGRVIKRKLSRDFPTSDKAVTTIK